MPLLQITFDEFKYRVRLYKQKSDKMFNLNDKVLSSLLQYLQNNFTIHFLPKVSDMIDETRANRNFSYHTVCLQIKHRGKKSAFRTSAFALFSPISSPASKEVESDSIENSFSSGSTPPPPLTPHYPPRQEGERDEYSFTSDDDPQDERSPNYLSSTWTKVRVSWKQSFVLIKPQHFCFLLQDNYSGTENSSHGHSSTYQSPYRSWPVSGWFV